MMYPIKLAKKLIGNEEFFFSAGDNILLGGLRKHYDDYKKNKSDAHILVVKRKDYRQFGVAVIKDGQLVKTVEKPKRFISDLVLTAIYFFKPVVFDAFDHIKPIDPNNTGKPEYYPPTVNNWLIKQGYKFTASEVTGWWKDTGKPGDLIEANQMVLDRDLEEFNKSKSIKDSTLQGRLQIESGVKIINSTIRGPVSIKNGSIVKNAYIGPYTSIGENCVIENSQIENSILLGNVTIENHYKRIDSSLFGWNTVLNYQNEGIANQYLIGDNSSIDLK